MHHVASTTSSLASLPTATIATTRTASTATAARGTGDWRVGVGIRYAGNSASLIVVLIADLRHTAVLLITHKERRYERNESQDHVSDDLE